MKVVKLKQNRDGDYSDGNITIKDLHATLYWTTKTVNDKDVTVPRDLSCHGFVKNIGKFLYKLTVIVTAEDHENFNIASVQDSVVCLDKDESWEFYARTDDLGYWKSELTYLARSQETKTVDCGKTRGQEIYDGGHAEGFNMKVYAIEEFNDEDYSGSLGQI